MNNRLLELSKSVPEQSESVIYVMSRDQRVRDNHALIEAQKEAIEHKLPLAVVFNLLPQTGHRRREHYEFMTEGLRQVEDDLTKKDIPFIMTVGSMPETISKLVKSLRPRTIYFDFSPLRGPRDSQKKLALMVDARVVVVDTHNIIPTWVVSDKEEFAAHTIRRKIHRNIEEWCVEPGQVKKHPHRFSKTPDSATWKEFDAVVAKVPKSGIKHGFESGEQAAKKTLQRFIETGIDKYAAKRNDATTDAQSDLSPYLHFGQISSLRIILDLIASTNKAPHLFTSFRMPSFEGSPGRRDSIDAFLEELIVRKELTDNFCLHQPHYDTLKGAKDWAKDSLKKHQSDAREYVYTYEQLEHAKTHDDLWNAAQTQLIRSGKIHGYMRMYWAKMILAWTESPATAVKWAIQLNDTYHLDGGDPNGYVGVMWSIAGIHDRPWFERGVFGKIRFMSANGIKKKFDTDAYIAEWSMHDG